jgi:hypothetical protein
MAVLPFNQAHLRCAGPCQSRSRATWRPSKYRNPSQAAFAPSVRSHYLSWASRASRPGRPTRLSPALIRCRIIVRSNSAKAPVSWETACPWVWSYRWPVGHGTSPRHKLQDVGLCRVSRSANGPAGHRPSHDDIVKGRDVQGFPYAHPAARRCVPKGRCLLCANAVLVAPVTRVPIICLQPGTRLAARRAFARMETAMFNPTQVVIDAFVQQLQKQYEQVYGVLEPG